MKSQYTFNPTMGAISHVCAVAGLFLLMASMAWADGKTLRPFSGANGQWPEGPLVFDKNGNLYGTTLLGGTNNLGTVFKLTHTPTGEWKQTTLYSFKGGSTDGSQPYAGVVIDAKGNLFGTTPVGGPGIFGTVYELSRSSDGTWAETILYSFTGKHDGSEPRSGLALDARGNLYGTTRTGGDAKCECGTVYKLIHHTGSPWTLSVLHAFNGANESTPTGDGVYAFGGVLLDGAGNVYGTTVAGGEFVNYGTVYELSPLTGGGYSYNVIYSFGGYTADGAQPEASLIMDAQGNLYGTTVGNRNGAGGTVFELSPSGGTWTERVLYQFLGGSDGFQPVAPVIFDSAGNLLGTTQQGGNTATCYQGSCGTIFELTPGAGGVWTESILYSFTNGVDGETPLAGLISDGLGNFYGTAQRGGRFNDGVVFEITP